MPNTLSGAVCPAFAGLALAAAAVIEADAVPTTVRLAAINRASPAVPA